MADEGGIQHYPSEGEPWVSGSPTPPLRLVGDGPTVMPPSDPDDAIVHDYQADGRTQGSLVPPEIAARMRWAGNYVLPGPGGSTAFWAADIEIGPKAHLDRPPTQLGCTILFDALIDTSEWRMEQRQGGQMPVLVLRRRTWRREVHLYGAALLWAEISEKQRQQARG